MKNLSKILLSLTAIILFSVGCSENDKFEDTPHLEWRSHEIRDTTGNRRKIVLTTYFTDGNGDIGRDSIGGDCPPPEAYDLLVSYFEKIEGEYVEIFPPDSCQPFHTTLPNITPEGQNKTLEGELSASFSYFGYPTLPEVDSVKFEVQLQDRSGLQSEIVSSGAIFIPPK